MLEDLKWFITHVLEAEAARLGANKPLAAQLHVKADWLGLCIQIGLGVLLRDAVIGAWPHNPFFGGSWRLLGNPYRTFSQFFP